VALAAGGGVVAFAGADLVTTMLQALATSVIIATGLTFMLTVAPQLASQQSRHACCGNSPLTR
jgi:hypothetical protein